MLMYEEYVARQIRISLKRLAALSMRSTRRSKRPSKVENNILMVITSIQVKFDKLVQQPRTSEYTNTLYQLRKRIDNTVEAIDDLEYEKTINSSKSSRLVDPLERVILRARV